MLQGESFFRSHIVCWQILGYLPPKSYRQLYNIYTVFVNVVITIVCPLHLLLGLLKYRTKFEILKNLTITLVTATCSIKSIVIWINFRNVEAISLIVARQDKRIQLSPDEQKYYKKVLFKSVKMLHYLFFGLYVFLSISSEAAVLFDVFVLDNLRLMYPGYFPFDVYANPRNYFVAHLYQWLGVTFQLVQNYVNDSMPPMRLALLSGQIRLLAMRVAKIGHDPSKSAAENCQELVECIQDHKDLLEYRNKLEKLISLYMFFQILTGGFNMCLVVVVLLLYVRDPLTFVYYFMYMIAMLIELYPACYYGTKMEIEFQNLTFALYSCNWMDQDSKFKKNLCIFSEQTLRPTTLMAGAFRINMDSFIAACKNAYSLFALIMNI